MKMCLLGFLGSLLEGSIGFGFCQIMGFYMLHSKMRVSAMMATCGFFTIFLAAILTFNRLFCNSFEGLEYLCIFSLCLGLIILFQYCLNSWLSGNLDSSTISSRMLIMCIVVQVFCLCTVVGAGSLDWHYFGHAALITFGSLNIC